MNIQKNIKLCLLSQGKDEDDLLRQDREEFLKSKEDTITISHSANPDWETYNEEQKKLFPNHGTPWTQEDEQLLTFLFTKKECSIDTLAQVFKKNHNAIQRKLERMELYRKIE